MNSRGLRLCTLVLLAICAGIPGTTAEPAGDDAFQPLFNGVDLTGWYGHNPHKTHREPGDERLAAVVAQQDAFHGHWRAEDGVLINDGQGPYATTNRIYGDIEFRLGYKTVPGADSGIYLRGNPQVQIWDTTEAGGKWHIGADKGSGGLWNNAPGSPGKDPLAHADRPFGEWNDVRIRQVGSRTWVWLNETLVVDGAIWENFWDKSEPLPRRGPIHLQTHGGEIRWRQLRLREIQPREANDLLRQRSDAEGGFEDLFNGRDLTGWTGARDSYEVVEGAIQCQPGEGGVLFTEEEFGDFRLRLEFRLPEGGNNGIAIRYPGEGKPAYDGMCELQVVDESAKRYDRLDPRQHHGSAYGIAAAHPGYLRPAGQWNYQEVTVVGSRVRVELNGTVILDEDLAETKRYLAGRAHPGKLREKGHLGFAGHHDPVAFRRIAVKRL